MNYTFKKNCYKSIQAVMLGVSVLGLSACGAPEEQAAPVVKDPNSLTLKDIETKAKEEGTINSVGMPDSWANWGETWNDVMKNIRWNTAIQIYPVPKRLPKWNLKERMQQLISAM